MELLIIGIFIIIIGFPIQKWLERRDSRWCNIALVLCIVVGMICIAIFAGYEP